MGDILSAGSEVQGEAARDSAVVGNPVIIGGRASTAVPSAVSADGDAVDAWFDRNGRAMVAVPDRVASGTLTAVDQTVELDVSGCGTAKVQISGTWVAMPIFEATVNGSDWVSTYVGLLGGPTHEFVPGFPNPANGIFLLPCSGFSKIRVRAYAYTSGTVNISMRAGAGSEVSFVVSDIANPGAYVGLVPDGNNAGAVKLSGNTPDVGVVVFGSGPGGTAPFNVDASGNLTAIAGGPVASDDIAAGYNPVLIGGRASTAVPSAVSADGDAVDAWYDRNGRAMVAIPDHTTTGTITANLQTVELSLDGSGTAAIQVSGTWVGVISLEVTVDGTNWLAGKGQRLQSTPSFDNAIWNGISIVPCAGFAKIRIKSYAWTSGTANVVMRYSSGSQASYLVDDPYNPATVAITPDATGAGPVGIDSAIITTGMAIAGRDDSFSLRIARLAPVDSDITHIALTTSPIDRVISGNITALDGTVELTINGASTAVVQSSGTWVGSWLVEGTVDDSVWTTLIVWDNNFSNWNGDSFFSNPSYPVYVGCGGLKKIRARANTFTSGTITININAGEGTTVVWPMSGPGLPVWNRQVDASGIDVAQIDGVSVGTGIAVQGVDGSGNRQYLTVDGSNLLKVNVVAGSAGGPSKVDDAAFTVATDSVAPIGAMADESSPDSVDEGDVGIVRMSLNRNLYTQIRDATNERSAAVTATNALVVDGSAVTQPVSIASAVAVTLAAGATAIAKAEDVASADGDVGVPAMAIRKGTPANTSSTDGDYEMLQMSAGRLWVSASNNGTFAVQDSEKVADNAGFTDGTTKVLPGGYIFDETAGTALTENDVAAARIDSKRAQVFVIEDETTRGRRATVTAGKALVVDGSGVTQPVSIAATVTVDTELPAAAALADGASATPTAPTIGAVSMLMNATTVDRQRAVVAALDSTGTGIAAAGLVGQLDDVSTATVTENQFAPVRISSRRALLVEGVASATAIKVDGSAVTQPVSLAAGAAAIAKAEDVASADADVGVPAMAVRKATPANTSGTDGDYEFLQISAGRLWASAVIDTALPAGTNLLGRESSSLETSTIYNGTTALTPKFALANIAASTTDGSIVAAVTAKKIRVLSLAAVAGGTATDITFNSKPAGAGAAISCKFANGANGGEILPFNPVGWFETVSGEGLAATTGAGSTTGIQVTYVEV